MRFTGALLCVLLFSGAEAMATKSALPNFIGGKWKPPSGAKGHVNSVNPATGEVVAQVPLSSASDLDEAVQAATAAFPAWSGMTIKQRAGIMMRFHQLLDDKADQLSELIILENGKNKAEALADLAKGNETVEWACSLPQLAAGRTLEVSGGVTCRESRIPLGVVAAIVPFNFPAMVPMWTIPISLTCGNCVILKPSEKVPSTMQSIAELLAEAGIPPGVFQIVHGAAEVVTAMCDHPDIQAVSFVGSSKVAEIVATRCHATHKRVLALGGAKNHLVALPDSDVGMTSRDVVASFAGCCGQRCMAASVLIIVAPKGEADVSRALLAEIVSVAGKLQPGQEAGMVGPLIDGIAKERTLKYIADSEAAGAKVLLDGRSWAAREAGFWVGPTILLHSNKDDKAVTEEIFGPVLSVLVVGSWEEAIAIENANPYGNAACVYTGQGAAADWFTKRFRAAMLGVNVGIPVPREPFSFGGLYGTLSKFGSYDVTGDGAMEFFTQRVKVTTKWTASYSTAKTGANAGVGNGVVDKASFDGRI